MSANVLDHGKSYEKHAVAIFEINRQLEKICQRRECCTNPTRIRILFLNHRWGSLCSKCAIRILSPFAPTLWIINPFNSRMAYSIQQSAQPVKWYIRGYDVTVGGTRSEIRCCQWRRQHQYDSSAKTPRLVPSKTALQHNFQVNVCMLMIQSLCGLETVDITRLVFSFLLVSDCVFFKNPEWTRI